MADGSTPEKQTRQLKKAERRAKQRELNPLRAEKMHKTRLAAPLPRADDAQLPKINIGCSGWFYWDWRGKFYPSQLPTSGWFALYRDELDTVELNAPFYAWPTVNTVRTWRRQIDPTPHFVYTVKVSELITHIKRFHDVKGLVEDFGYIADLLGPHMGCFLYQFPASYRYSRAALDEIVTQLDHSRRNVVEFRHESWWNEEVYAAFRAHGTIFCACSGPGLPDQLIKTADEIYVRFHGVDRWYLYDYSDAELQVWADRIRQSGATRVWAYFNNDYNANAPKNAKRLIELLAEN
jgi:uncharacterized protein YecE (DUF72 family)